MDIISQLRSAGMHLWSGGSNACDRKPISANIYEEAKARIEAMLLIELGARSSLVCRLTGLPKATAKRLYRRIHGHYSPGGQAPFTDTWYLQNEQRMLHANIVWQLYKALELLERGPAENLINLYEMYLLAVQEPLLDLGHIEFVPRLVQAGIWQPRVCEFCRGEYVSPGTDIENVCPACTLQHLYRCPYCNSALKPREVGRRMEHCPQCGERLRHLAS